MGYAAGFTGLNGIHFGIYYKTNNWSVSPDREPEEGRPWPEINLLSTVMLKDGYHLTFMMKLSPLRGVTGNQCIWGRCRNLRLNIAFNCARRVTNGLEHHFAKGRVKVHFSCNFENPGNVFGRNSPAWLLCTVCRVHAWNSGWVLVVKAPYVLPTLPLQPNGRRCGGESATTQTEKLKDYHTHTS